MYVSTQKSESYTLQINATDNPIFCSFSGIKLIYGINFVKRKKMYLNSNITCSTSSTFVQNIYTFREWSFQIFLSTRQNT